jgi:glutamate-1-semialdehyde aminotransferase
MLLPTIPWSPGEAPVVNVAVLTRVTVGKTAWLLVYSTPSRRRRAMFGVSRSLTLSGRSPSMTKIATRRADALVHGMLEQGIYLPPSAFESYFLNDALSYGDLDETITALERVVPRLK